jgi:hypothetical protein
MRGGQTHNTQADMHHRQSTVLTQNTSDNSSQRLTKGMFCTYLVDNATMSVESTAPATGGSSCRGESKCGPQQRLSSALSGILRRCPPRSAPQGCGPRAQVSPGESLCCRFYLWTLHSSHLLLHHVLQLSYHSCPHLQLGLPMKLWTIITRAAAN